MSGFPADSRSNSFPFPSLLLLDLEDPPITLTSRTSRMRHSSQSDEAPPTSCTEVFQAGVCDLEASAPSSLARSSSASDIMEPFIAERVKGEDPQRDCASIPTHCQHPTVSSLLTANIHAAQPCPRTPTSPSPTPHTFSNGVVSSSEAQDDGSIYDQFWQHVDFQNKGSDWVSEWDSAFVGSSEKEMEEYDIGPGLEEDDLFSSIRDYFTQKGGEWKEETGEKASLGASVNMPASSQTGAVRTPIDCTEEAVEARQVLAEDRQVSKPARHSSVDSAEENEEKQRSIYECLELQCHWPSPGAKTALERHTGETKAGKAGMTAVGEGKCDAWGETVEETPDEQEVSIRQDAKTVESTTDSNQALQNVDTDKYKSSLNTTKRHHPGSVHVSFRPATESVQFHNPLDSKEAHWKARLRRLSHFHTHSHSAGERGGAGAGSAAKMGAGATGKFGSGAGISHRGGAHEKSASGTPSDNSGVGNAAVPGGVESRPGGDKDRHVLGSSTGPDSHTDAPPSSSVFSGGPVSGVRGRLGRSALRSRASRSRSQEPRSSASRHHQGALLGGVYKTVVHALSSKPRPRGQGSSQGSSPQRQGRTAMADASLRDLYSHVLGYFGRKTTAAGEDRNNNCSQRTQQIAKELGKTKHTTRPTSTTVSFFSAVLTGLLWNVIIWLILIILLLD